jgi:murein DD-endopeptidase MepM/ murein hydrolase activator NlpD
MMGTSIVKSGLVVAAAIIWPSSLLATTPPLVDLKSIVPEGARGEHAHGSYPWKGDRTHAGVDISAPCKTSAIKAWRSGTVIDVIDSKKDRNFNELGYMVIIDHGLVSEVGKRTFSVYFHMSAAPKGEGGKKLSLDTKVSAGERIGMVGQTGAVESCLLHFELRHFSSRFSPDWLSIHGSGDKRKSTEFMSDWTDPYRPVGQLASKGGDLDSLSEAAFISARVTSNARHRNKPSTSGSVVLRTFMSGEVVSGQWVQGTDPATRWLKTAENGYIWDGNLSETTAIKASEEAVPSGFVLSAEINLERIKGTVNFSEPSKMLADSNNCPKKTRAIIKKLSKSTAKCIGYAINRDETYAFSSNWLISDDRPGIIQLLHNDRAVGDIAAEQNGTLMLIETASGKIDILSVAPASGNAAGRLPYLHYRLQGGHLALISSKMFPPKGSPVDSNRKLYAGVVEKAAAEKREQQSNQAMLLAQREAEPAAANPRVLPPGPGAMNGNIELVAWHRIYIHCGNMNGLVSRLDIVVNEMQVYNNDEATWHNKGSCTLNLRREIAGRDFLGWYNTGKFYVGIEMVRYHDVPDAPERPKKKKIDSFLGLKITDAKNVVGMRPIYIVRSKFARLPSECFQATVTNNGVTLFGNSGSGPLEQCIPNVGYKN